MRANPRVLIVDDHPINRRLPAMLLRARGWSCDQAADGEEALAKLAASRFDAVLLDIGMPGLSGHEVCQRIRADADLKTLWVIAYTANALSEAELNAAGFDGILGKPMTPEQLFDALKGAAGRDKP